MARLVHISEAANLAIHALAYLGACEKGTLHSVSQIARCLGVSGAHLSKVLQQLARFGLARSSRGSKGGFSLARDPDDVTLLEIVEIFDGPISMNQCLLETQLCQGGSCALRKMLESVYKVVLEHLKGTRLSDFEISPDEGGGHGSR